MTTERQLCESCEALRAEVARLRGILDRCHLAADDAAMEGWRQNDLAKLLEHRGRLGVRTSDPLESWFGFDGDLSEVRIFHGQTPEACKRAAVWYEQQGR